MDTLLTILTPPGKAAIATLAVRGPLAWAVARTLFQPPNGALPDAPTPGRFRFGKLGGDEVILAVKESTPTPSLEIHCHGGVVVVRMIAELFTERGVRSVPWQEFVTDSAPIQELLANAPTARAAAILLDQWQGAWDACMRSIEATNADQRLQRLRDLIPLGRHLVEPWKVVIAGAPNVGKSSLINALAGYTRSIVSPIPGTTRDVVTLQGAIDGWPVELTDTAGIRLADSALENEGIARARTAVGAADLRIWLLNGSAPPVLPDELDRCIYVINQCDLPAGWDWDRFMNAPRISAQTRMGIEELCEVISQRLVPAPPLPGEAVPCLPEQVEWVRTAMASRPRETASEG
jgi:tRNA modification GTPase